jgi:hypothetical protein
VQTLDDEIEDLQDSLFSDANPGLGVQRRSFELRKSLVLLRRVVLPMREVVNTLMRRDLHIVDDVMALYFQDVYDHVLRATEWTESLRDLVTTILETRLTIQGNRLNEIMKKLTARAAIIAVPTAVTGFYGQNVPYPGFQQPWGFVSSITLIIVIGVGLYVTFRRNDWLCPPRLVRPPSAPAEQHGGEGQLGRSARPARCTASDAASRSEECRTWPVARCWASSRTSAFWAGDACPRNIAVSASIRSVVSWLGAADGEDATDGRARAARART